MCAGGHPLVEGNRRYGKVRADGTRSYTCLTCYRIDRFGGPDTPTRGRRRKDECPRGHALTVDNRVYGRVAPDGGRYYACKRCHQEKANASRRARRAERRAA